MFLFLACTDKLNGCRRWFHQCSHRNVRALCKKTCGVCTGLFYFNCLNFLIPIPHILLSFYPWGHAKSSRDFANAPALALFLFDKGAASLLGVFLKVASWIPILGLALSGISIGNSMNCSDISKLLYII